MNNKQDLISVLVEPITLDSLVNSGEDFHSIKNKIKYAKDEKGGFSFINQNQYQSPEEFKKIEKIINFWGSGWEKRLTEEDHSLFTSADRQKLIDIAKNSMSDYLGRSGFGSLFSTEVDFKKINNKIGLNIGCGDGAEANLLICEGKANVIAMDLTKEARNSAQSAMNKLGIGIAIQADSRFLPIASDSIDFVYSGGVIHHSPDIHKSVNEIYRVLKPGGEAYISLYNNTSHYFMYVKLRAILAGNFTKKSINNYLSKNTEQSWETSDIKNPHTRTFGYSAVKKLFRDFSKIESRKGNFYANAFSQYFIKLRLQNFIFKLFHRYENKSFLCYFGMMICIKVTK